MSKISIVLVEDHAVVRDGLKALLAGEPDMQVVGEAENGQQAVSLAKKLSPDVVVMDLAMPLMNGLTATREILKAVPSAKILVLSSYSDDECVRSLMDAGAMGYLMKQTASNELVEAIRHTRRGNQVFSPAISQRIRAQRAGAFMDGGTAALLTAREMQVLKLIARGGSNKEIATELDISIKTVEKHRQQVMNKLNIHDVAGLTRYAISKGLVERGIPAGVVN